MSAEDPRRFQAAVFDLDGTLVDSETRSHESWRHVFTSRGIVPDDSLIRAFVGRRGVDVHDLLRERVPGHDPAELMAATSAHFHGPHQPPLGPLAGAVELVRAIGAAGVPLALVTSAGRRYAEENLTELGVRPLFSVVVTAEDVAVGKPDPQGYLAAARGLGVPPAACVVFEDAPAGVSGREGGRDVLRGGGDHPSAGGPRRRRPGRPRPDQGHLAPSPPPDSPRPPPPRPLPDLFPGPRLTWPRPPPDLAPAPA